LIFDALAHLRRIDDGVMYTTAAARPINFAIPTTTEPGMTRCCANIVGFIVGFETFVAIVHWRIVVGFTFAA